MRGEWGPVFAGIALAAAGCGSNASPAPTSGELIVGNWRAMAGNVGPFGDLQTVEYSADHTYEANTSRFGVTSGQWHLRGVLLDMTAVPSTMFGMTEMTVNFAMTSDHLTWRYGDGSTIEFDRE